MLTFALAVSFSTDCLWYCFNAGWVDETLGHFTELCPEYIDLHHWYSLASFATTVLYFAMCVRLSVMNMRQSAYVLVCSRMLHEVVLFVLAETFTVVAFGLAIGCVDHYDADFQGSKNAMQSLAMIILSFYPNAHFEKLQNEPFLLIAMAMFYIISFVLLANMLIAQINVVYSTSLANMVGLARLSRVRVVVETMPSASRRLWNSFVVSQKFDERLEFNKGDLGLAGGVQVLEPAFANPTFFDTIQRFGGLTSLSTPWPEDVAEEEVYQFQALEVRLMAKIQQLLGRQQGETGSSVEGSSQPGS